MRIFGPKREEVAGGWKIQHNEQLNNLNPSPKIRVIKSRKMRWVMHVARIGQMRNAYTVLVRKPEGKRQLQTPRYRWKNVRMSY
jgi:hypothetical protein